MSEMGLSRSCHDINQMDAGRLIEQFQDVERNAEKLKLAIRQKVDQSRKALEEQYRLILRARREMSLPSRRKVHQDPRWFVGPGLRGRRDFSGGAGVVDGGIADCPSEIRSENFIVINSQVSHPILEKAARLQFFGKSPASFYLRLNKRMWEHLPSRVRNLYPVRCYMAWLHTLICLRARRQQFFGTFFLRNRPALELMRRLARAERSRLDLENCRAGLQYRGRSLFNPLDHPLGTAGLKSAPGCGWIFRRKY